MKQPKRLRDFPHLFVLDEENRVVELAPNETRWETWARKNAERGTKNIVGQNFYEEGLLEVTTIFGGIDIQYTMKLHYGDLKDGEKPKVFHTNMFLNRGVIMQKPSTSWEEAEKNHNEITTKIMTFGVKKFLEGYGGQKLVQRYKEAQDGK